MTFKNVVKSSFVLCIAAILVIALCGCDDLGAYENTEEYYSAFGDIILIDGTLRNVKEYSVEDYFYSKDSRENFLVGEDGSYNGVEHNDYMYMAIPFESNIDMDTLALYLQSQSDVTVYISVFLIDDSEWNFIKDNGSNSEETGDVSDTETENETEEVTGEASDTETGDETEAATGEAPDAETGDESEKNEEVYNGPSNEKRIGDVTVHLKEGQWNSFMLDYFNVNGATQKSIQIKEGQYILLQFRNNGGPRVFDMEKQIYVDPVTGLELPKAEITMTNLLIRALDIEGGTDSQGGE